MTSIEHNPRPRDRARLAAWYTEALEGQASSGMSVASYASRIGVTAATLYQWKRRLAGRNASGADEVNAARSSGLIQVALEAPRTQRTPEKYIVHLRSGRSIDVPHDFEAEALEQLLTVLEPC